MLNWRQLGQNAHPEESNTESILNEIAGINELWEIDNVLVDHLVENPIESIYEPSDDYGYEDRKVTIVREVLIAAKDRYSSIIFIEFDSRFQETFDKFKA